MKNARLTKKGGNRLAGRYGTIEEQVEALTAICNVLWYYSIVGFLE